MGAAPEQSDRRQAPGQPGRLGARIIARVVDALILGAVGGTVGVAMDFDVTWLVVQAAVVFAYFVALDVTWGTTPGKRLVGLRVTGPDGDRPTPGQAAIRESFTLLGAIPYLGPILALGAWIVIIVTVKASPTGQGRHDTLAGGTRVLAR